VEKRAAASTVNLALASLDALYRCLGLGRPNVRRKKPIRAAPRALDEAGQRGLLRAAEAAPVRARALVMLMLFTALRISETVALVVDDIRITARKGVLVVLGKGELRREVPLNALVRQVLEEWLAERAKLVREGERALWVSRTGRRLERSAAGRCISIRAGRATATTCSVWPASASAAPRRCPPASTNCAWSSPTTAAAPPKAAA